MKIKALFRAFKKPQNQTKNSNHFQSPLFILHSSHKSKIRISRLKDRQKSFNRQSELEHGPSFHLNLLFSLLHKNHENMTKLSSIFREI
jgi:hypothetical protein